MPGMSAVDLQAGLLTQGYRVPFIFITAFPEENIRARALKAGAICFLTKPFNGCGQLLMYRYFGNSILIDLLPELFPPGFREHERTQA